MEFFVELNDGTKFSTENVDEALSGRKFVLSKKRLNSEEQKLFDTAKNFFKEAHIKINKIEFDPSMEPANIDKLGDVTDPMVCTEAFYRSIASNFKVKVEIDKKTIDTAVAELKKGKIKFKKVFAEELEKYPLDHDFWSGDDVSDYTQDIIDKLKIPALNKLDDFDMEESRIIKACITDNPNYLG